MLEIPSGDFLMGSIDGKDSEDAFPQHTVHLDTFLIDQTEVTNAMFSDFVQKTGYVTGPEQSGAAYILTSSGWQNVIGADWKHPQGPDSSIEGLDNHPVVQISWDDASAYCTWAGKRLPTEAEWEKAARGIDGQAYPWGNEPPDGNLVNFADSSTTFDWSNKDTSDGYEFTAPVGSYPAGGSPFGVLDMSGNVWEWTADWYASDYYTTGQATNPTGPVSGDRHVIRGGSWSDEEINLRSDYRCSYCPSFPISSIVGFRCAMSKP
jgi:serine/threonine-protein kinase